MTDYTLLGRQLDALLAGEADTLACLSNVTALLKAEIPDLNWVGFYRRIDNELILGPFQGNVACTRIPMGAGVCGTAAASASSVRVDDVHRFEGHIACDSNSNSELVVPIILDNQVVAVLDLDSPSKGRFKEHDEQGITAIAAQLKAYFPQEAALLNP